MAEEATLECQLEEQLAEHKESLAMLREALVHDPSNEEISLLCEELVSAVRGCEESLVYFKRTRLLREIDAPSSSQPDTPVAPDGFVPGSKCRFRFTDGRWYNGKIMEMQNDEDHALVSFLAPTDGRMQICKFYLQQRCRFGDSCRSSHGFRVSVSSLKEFVPCKPGDIEIGSVVLASNPTDATGLWQKAEVEEWDSVLQRGRVVFTDDGSRSNVDAENVIVTDYSSSSSSEIEDDDDENGTLLGIGCLNGTGQQNETVAFATWEKHTKGIASKIMAGMGYIAGTGLGVNAQGNIAPLQVRVLPPRTSLDFLNQAGPRPDPTRKKKSRGGKRKRDKKYAEAARAAKAQETEKTCSDVFDFINVQLASSGKKKKKQKEEVATGKEDRHTLVMKEDEIKQLAGKVAKLEEMAHRNRKETPVFEAMSRKLVQARKTLRDAQDAHSSMAKAVLGKEQQKKWSRF